MRKRLKVVTVGCKANFADSAAVVRAAVGAGFAIVPPAEPADLVIINSCTVTHRADRDSRALARRARRENPGAVIVLAGCYARVAPQDRNRLPEVDHWIGPGEAESPNRAPLEEILRTVGGPGADPTIPPSLFEADRLLGHRRTFLKIQDGCDSACAYCVVPRARGRSRSFDEGEILAAAEAAEEEGARELVLTGIHIGRYGADRGERGGLPTLIRRLLDRTSRARFRISSVEPQEITEELLALPASTSRVCPHFHVPLQSGSDRVLSRMRRPYTARQYRSTVEMIADRLPGVAIGADVMAGFPGESEKEFRETLRLIRDLPIHYLHAFPYSPRPGTESAQWEDDVSPGEKKERVAALRALDRKLRGAYASRQTGAVLEVLVERPIAGGREWSGRSGNYLEVRFPARDDLEGALCPVRITGTRNGVLTGVPDG
ncbi:MAG: tRNA (N(6)-L-threonylcarbamoyladenosine(37)-C(2))-methylthiotransferase MtaB [Deltaproteobacteria bacterium]